jgi:hypothetical protein
MDRLSARILAGVIGVGSLAALFKTILDYSRDASLP